MSGAAIKRLFMAFTYVQPAELRAPLHRNATRRSLGHDPIPMERRTDRSEVVVRMAFIALAHATFVSDPAEESLHAIARSTIDGTEAGTQPPSRLRRRLPPSIRSERGPRQRRPVAGRTRPPPARRVATRKARVAHTDKAVQGTLVIGLGHSVWLIGKQRRDRWSFRLPSARDSA